VVVAEILEGAREIALREGLEALTLQRLARELGYVPAALYRYFPSKDALLAELLGLAIEAASTSIGRAWELVDAAKAPPPLAALIAAVDAYLALSERELRLIVSAVGDPRVVVEREEDARSVLARAGPLLFALTQRFDRAAEAGALSEGSGGERALMLFAGVHGVLALEKLLRFGDALGLDRLARAQTRALFTGFGASAGAITAAERWLAKVAKKKRSTK